MRALPYHGEVFVPLSEPITDNLSFLSCSETMKLLALETSTVMGSIALFSNGELISEYQTGIRHTYSEQLLPLIDQMLSTSGVSIDEIDSFAVAQGPGSFTSLRIGISVIIGLALARHKQVIPVPSLDALAYNVCLSRHLICPLLDARKGEVYAAFYRQGVNTALERITPYRVIKPETLVEDITEPVVFLGDGTALYRNLLVDKLHQQALFAPVHLSYPRASAIAALALHYIRDRAHVENETIAPLYVRTPEAGAP